MVPYLFMTRLAKTPTFETDLEQQSFTCIASVALEQWFSYFFMTLPAPTLALETDLGQQSITFILEQVLLWSNGFPTVSWH